MTRAWRALATLILVVSVGLLASSLVPSAAPSTDVPEVTPTVGVTSAPSVPTPTPSPTAKGRKRTPSATSTPTPTPLMGQVLGLSLPKSGYDSAVRPMDVGTSGVINPPNLTHLFRITDRGVSPSSAATDTTYFACHTDAKKSAAAVPCNALTSLTVAVGDPLLVTLTDGVLTYDVVQARKVPRSDFEHDREVWDVHPGRLVLVTCYLSEGRRTDYNFVIIAEPRPEARG